MSRRADAPASAAAWLADLTGSGYAALRVAAWQALMSSCRATGDLSGAFAAADALVSEGDAEATEALASATALVVAAFPGAVTEGGPAKWRAGAAAVASGTATDAASLDVWPNPSAGEMAVRLSGVDAATVAVYDALGRRVSVLHDGAVPAGGLALALDGARLPAGVYVVHARVTASGGEAQTLVRRVTVVR